MWKQLRRTAGQPAVSPCSHSQIKSVGSCYLHKALMKEIHICIYIYSKAIN